MKAGMFSFNQRIFSPFVNVQETQQRRGCCGCGSSGGGFWYLNRTSWEF